MAVTLAERPRLLEPGLPRFEPGVERYRVAGGGAVVLALSAGDRLTLIDLEGRQRAEVAAFGPVGVEDPDALGLSMNGPAEGISRLLAGADEAATGYRCGPQSPRSCPVASHGRLICFRAIPAPESRSI